MTDGLIEVSVRHARPGFRLDCAFTAPASGVTALFGPSGAGKSTVIAALSGLLRPDHARISIAGQVLTDTAAGLFVPPHRRRVGLVFQDSRLFPHLSVRSNLRYGLWRARGPVVTRFDDVVALLGIGHLLRARPVTLSGGERQRVALGRALLSQPRVLLMDEPLASLDAARKAEILPFLSRLRASLAVPIVYVTHAIEEVARLADTLVLLEAGRVLAAGPVADLSSRPDLALARADDAGAVATCAVVVHDPPRGLTRLDCGGMSLLVPLLDAAPGTMVRVRVPARDVILATSVPEAISVHNVLGGRVAAVDIAGDAALVEIDLGGARLLARVTRDAIERLKLTPGRDVLALVKSVAVQVLR